MRFYNSRRPVAGGREGMTTVYAFACRPVWAEERFDHIINETSAGRAKAEYLRCVSDPLPDLKFTQIRCRKIGAAQTSADFIRNAKYRGWPDAKCGDCVQVEDWEGVIVGHNSSANFDILATSGRWKGLRLNVHPNDVTLITEPRK
jgi:hypothetical protein